MEFTQSQQAATEAFKAFLEGDEQVFMLKGAAGTGKTTLVAEFLKTLAAENRPVRLLAPTGRAAYVIGRKTGKPAFTIHKGIYALSALKSASRSDEDENDDGLYARFGLKENKASVSAVYIVDEASMVSDAFSRNEAFSFGSGQLLTDLFEFVGGRKMVFVGDYAQLPPIGMNFSPALDKEYIEQKFGCKVSEHILREVIRQSTDSVMLANATRIRDSIASKSFIEFRLEEGNDSIAENSDLLQPYFLLSESKPPVKSAIITYTNQQALQYNQAVRRHFYGADAPRLLKGDLLMIGRNNYAYEEELFNGSIVQVEACDTDADVEHRIVRVKTGKNRIDSVELRFRKATIHFMRADGPVSLNITLLDNFLDDPSGVLSGLPARALIVDFNNRLPESIRQHLTEIKRAMRSGSTLSVKQQELYDAYLKLLHHDRYYNAVICKYGYAMTCHKAQGGEWDNVFVDMCRLGGTSNEDYFRWAYTALTRASKKLWHYRSPEFNFISKLVVEPIQRSNGIKVSTYSFGDDFCSSRLNSITEWSEKRGITVSEDKSRAYQHWLTFTDERGENATYILWYNAKGYSGKEVLHSSTSERFAAECRSILERSFVPDTIPFVAPQRPLAERLVSFVKSQLEELDIQLLNITQEQFQDVFHLKTDGVAKVALSYTNKGNYTHMRLQSSLGEEDAKLEALRKRFI